MLRKSVCRLSSEFIPKICIMAVNNQTLLYEKYADSVRLYAEIEMSGIEIAKQRNVPVTGFRAYLYRHHRELVLVRYGMEGADESVKIHPRKGQHTALHIKYKEAVAACDNIDLNQRYLKSSTRICSGYCQSESR